MCEAMTLPGKSADLEIAPPSIQGTKACSQTALVSFELVKDFLSKKPLRRPARIQLTRSTDR